MVGRQVARHLQVLVARDLPACEAHADDLERVRAAAHAEAPARRAAREAGDDEGAEGQRDEKHEGEGRPFERRVAGVLVDAEGPGAAVEPARKWGIGVHAATVRGPAKRALRAPLESDRRRVQNRHNLRSKEGTNVTVDKDRSTLHALGYAQELSRRMSGFSNFAISFTIISILSG